MKYCNLRTGKLYSANWYSICPSKF